MRSRCPKTNHPTRKWQSTRHSRENRLISSRGFGAALLLPSRKASKPINAYVPAFEAREASSDSDEDGFVIGLDCDMFVGALEATRPEGDHGFRGWNSSTRTMLTLLVDLWRIRLASW